jgi:RNA polymerase sigma-70 factor (ECF subfamily)
MAYSWSHNADVAEEVVQETMIKALKNVDRIKNDDALDGWVFRILSNCFIDYCRKQRNEIELDDTALIEENTPESIHCQNEMLVAIRIAIASLPFKHRQVLTLIDIENFTYAEVAEIIDAPLGTIMSRLNRARQSLRQKLKEQKALDLDYRAKLKKTKLKIVP